ncbi:substrate-binding domain-containing protein [Sorangium sp. So ce131]|uniref:substrate-binding domain-containing protein n=1 Tax=Sorangium sp. So ce131 TaxID=3133282 RepID=UPI003F61C671
MTRIGRCWMACFGLALMTAACGESGAPGSGDDGAPITRPQAPTNEFTPMELEATIDDLVAEINKSSITPMQMGILLKTVSAFFAPVATGANRAMGELGVTGDVIGPPDQTGDQQKKMELQNRQIEQTVMEGAEGIGISPFGDANAALIDEAVDAGVHVVTLDTDLATSRRSIYVGTINKAAGVKAGETLMKMLPPGPGTVILHGSDDPTWVDGLERTQGAQDVLEKAGYTAVVRPVIFNDEGEGEDVEAMKDQIATADPPVVGLIGLFSVAYRCAMATEAAERTDIPVVTFDFDPRTVAYMREGLVKATLIQRQYYEGYLVPYILYGIKNLGLDATKAILAPRMVDDSRFNLGLDVVPGDKVDAYNAFLDSIGANQ